MAVTKDDRGCEILNQFLDAQGIAKDARPVLIAKITAIVQTAKGDAPKWRERNKYKELKNLSAVQFLLRVHAASIVNKTVCKDVIRRVDRPLMDRVDSYISQREGRGLDLGDAAGLVLVASHRAANSRKLRNREPT